VIGLYLNSFAFFTLAIVPLSSLLSIWFQRAHHLQYVQLNDFLQSLEEFNFIVCCNCWNPNGDSRQCLGVVRNWDPKEKV
jgi:hypothetical protein